MIERFEPGRGGVENVAWHVARGLAAAGESVTVLARRSHATPGVPVEILHAPTAWQPWRVLAFSRAAGRAASAGRYDVVHSFSRTLHQDVYRAGGGSHAEYMERQYGRRGAALRRYSPRHATLRWIEARVFGDSSQIIQCNSELVRRQIQTRHHVSEARLVVIRNGVDLERFRPGGPPRAAREGVPRWLFLGSGWRRKGLDTALRALAVARGEGELHVAGRDAPGPWQALAARLGVAARVHFLGSSAEPERLYREADALLLPTRYDAFANVCLEALACGLPVVTSGANGAAEILGPAGLVVPDAEDVAGFARALEVLADPAARAKRADGARAVAEACSWPAHVAALRALYARVRR